jgi:hypothetical protein
MAQISASLSHTGTRQNSSESRSRPLRRLCRRLRLARQRRLLRELDRRATWAEQARIAPTLADSAALHHG